MGGHEPFCPDSGVPETDQSLSTHVDLGHRRQDRSFQGSHNERIMGPVPVEARYSGNYGQWRNSPRTVPFSDSYLPSPYSKRLDTPSVYVRNSQSSSFQAFSSELRIRPQQPQMVDGQIFRSFGSTKQSSHLLTHSLCPGTAEASD
jgi:hypothetical protein